MPTLEMGIQKYDMENPNQNWNGIENCTDQYSFRFCTDRYVCYGARVVKAQALADAIRGEY